MDKKNKLPQDYESLSHYFNKKKDANYDFEIEEAMGMVDVDPFIT